MMAFAFFIRSDGCPEVGDGVSAGRARSRYKPFVRILAGGSKRVALGSVAASVPALGPASPILSSALSRTAEC